MLSTAFILTACSSEDQGENQGVERKESQIEVQEILSPSPGVTEDQITPQVVAAEEEAQRKKAQAKLDRNVEQYGSYSKNPEVSVYTRLVNISNERAMVTHVKIIGEAPEPSSIYAVAWVQQEQIKTVLCTSKTEADFNYRRGKCGDQIQSTFGYRNWKEDD